LDEAENHLHPSMQREFLPNLLKTFPEANFIVSTHSPLIVGSVREANVYVLKYNDGKKVVSEKLDLADKTRNALEILDEVLGVTTTLPIWVETELASILKDVSKNGITENSFSEIRKRLHAIGMEHLMPEAISKLL
jgi:predicted ATP-binding protein involved in virulence